MNGFLNQNGQPQQQMTPDMSEMERQRIMEQIRMIRERKD